MGRPKALLEHPEGGTFLEHLAATYRQAGVRQRVLVLNAALIGGPAEAIARAQGLWVVANNAPWLGKWHSLRLGMSALRDPGHCFVQAVDQPGITAPLLESLSDAARPGGYVVPVHGDRGGHPLLVSRPIIERLLDLEADLHLQEVLAPFPRTDVPVDDPCILLDINTPEEHAAFRAAAIAP